MTKKVRTQYAKTIIKTIEDSDDVEDFSEDSDEEVEFQPSKQKKKRVVFDNEFEFVTYVEEYNKNTWNDLHKYVKRKAKTKTDDKIKELIDQNDTKDELDPGDDKNEVSGYNSDVSLSSADLQHDHIRTKEKQKKKKKREEPESTADKFTEDPYAYDENINFYQMNLSRPLMKAITQMKFTHSTPIQAATIPVALLGTLSKYLTLTVQEFCEWIIVHDDRHISQLLAVRSTRQLFLLSTVFLAIILTVLFLFYGL